MKKLNVPQGLKRNKDYIIIIDTSSIPDNWEFDKWIEHIDTKGVICWNSQNCGREDRKVMTVEPKIVFINKK